MARTTTEDTKALGFSIYYTLVNFGGAIGPIIALAVRENVGISYVLVISSLTTLVLFIAHRDVLPRAAGTGGRAAARSMGQVLADMVMVFGNLRFMLFLLIFSGFWAMFWHIFYALPFYVKDYLQYSRFEIIETVDAWIDHSRDDSGDVHRAASAAAVSDGAGRWRWLRSAGS